MAKRRSHALRAKKAIDKVRDPFMSLVNPPRRLDIAHDFMHAFAVWRASQPGLPSFAAFVRLFDPTVPTHPGGDDGYMRHRTYMKACYLQKLAKR